MTHRAFSSERHSPEWVSLRPRGLRAGRHIPSDPELENQINDRISFKKFLGLTLDKPSPDHSTFRILNPIGHRPSG